MQSDFVILIILLIFGFAVIIYIVKKELSKLTAPTEQTTVIEWLKSMQTSLESTNKTLNEAMRGSTTDVAKLLQENSKQLNTRLDAAAKVIGDLKRSFRIWLRTWRREPSN